MGKEPLSDARRAQLKAASAKAVESRRRKQLKRLERELLEVHDKLSSSDEDTQERVRCSLAAVQLQHCSKRLRAARRVTRRAAAARAHRRGDARATVHAV